MNTKIRLSGNALKIIALIAMTIDHIGLIFFPMQKGFRIIGRLAFPIFGFMISEGCKYTKNRSKYLGLILGLGMVYQIFYYVVEHSLYQSVFMVFSLSIIIIYMLDNYRKDQDLISLLMLLVTVLGIVIIVEVIPRLFPLVGLEFDYGIFGVFLPVVAYLVNEPDKRLMVIAFDLLFIALIYGNIQLWSLFSIFLLALYSFKRGKYNLKYFFYVYYPLHLVLLYGLKMIIS